MRPWELGLAFVVEGRNALYEYSQRPIWQALRQNGLSEKLVYRTPPSLQPLLGRLPAASRGCSSIAVCPLSGVDVYFTGLYRKRKTLCRAVMVSDHWRCLPCGGIISGTNRLPQGSWFLNSFSGRQFQPMITIGNTPSFFLSIVCWAWGFDFSRNSILIFFFCRYGYRDAPGLCGSISVTAF